MHDYVIVGGGSAGSALAARLTEDPNVRVLLLEAGPRDRSVFIHWPVGFFKTTKGQYTWGYKTAPQRHAGNREIPLAQGRVIGGSSSINAEVFTRGCPQDFDRWANEEDCPGWSSAEVEPYFLRLEDNDLLSGARHGNGGPLGVSTNNNPHPITKLFVQGGQQAGLPYNPDFNSGDQLGIGLYQTTTRNARRCSVAVAYLKEAEQRPNLEVRTDCLTERVVIENGRAVGIDYRRRGGGVERANAAREIIVSAGAIGSPKLLKLSGIGPAEELRRHDIDVKVDLPGVGANLQDHFTVDIIYELRGIESLDRYNKLHWKLWAGLEYLMFRKGPVASNIVEGCAFAKADANAPTPDLQFHFLAGAGVEAGIPPVASGSGCTMNSYCLRPRSRGNVTLTSANAADAPRIDPNYLGDPYDVRMAIEGMKWNREIMAQSALAGVLQKEHLPGAQASSQADLEDYVRNYGRTAYHPVGTCRMGVSEEAVVDTEFRVRGVEALRVIDASVMPSLVSSNTNATAIMFGERGADILAGKESVSGGASEAREVETPGARAVRS